MTLGRLSKLLRESTPITKPGYKAKKIGVSVNTVYAHCMLFCSFLIDAPVAFGSGAP